MGDLSQHFSRSEFACRCGCKYDTVDTKLIELLEDLRSFFRERVTINSGTRCPTHNQKSGGGLASQHLFGKAADVVVENVHADRVADYLESRWSGKYGVGRYKGRCHVDVRSTGPARWDIR